MKLQEVCQELKKSREEKNLTPGEVSLQTKLAPNVIKNIESTESLQNLGKFYLKGFLKIYAEFLGRNDLLEEINNLSSKTQKQKSPPEKGTAQKTKQKKEPPSASKKTNPLESTQKTPPLVNNIKKIKPPKKIIHSIFIIISVILIFLFIKSLFTGPKKTSGEKMKANQPVKEKRIAKEPTSTAEKQISKPIASLLTKGKVFIKVHSDGKLISSSFLSKGLQETWKAQKQLKLRISNPSLVTLEISGELIPTSNQRSTATYIITSKGFKVKK